MGFDGHRRRIVEQAADWYARMQEPASEAEVQAFEAWLGADPKHPKAYAEAESLASLATRMPRSLLARQTATTRPARFRPAFGIAAAVVLALAGAIWMTGPASQPAHAAISNPGPAVRGFTLSDGTRLILDSGAELAVIFERDARAVTLRSGRVRFNVAPDPDRPFSVTAAQSTLTGQNTVFDVSLDQDEVRVWVIDGELSLAAYRADANAVALRSGQVVNVRDGQPNETALEPGSARWPAARLAFDDAPLATIVAVANRQGSPKIEIHDEAVAALRVTGVLDVRDTRSLARKLAATLDLQAEVRASGILLTR
jgi:transmembrane sensor